MRRIPLAESGHLSNLASPLVSSRSVILFWSLRTFLPGDVEVVKDITFSSDHWPVFVSCAPSKLWNLREKAKRCTSRVPRRWCPTDQLVDGICHLDASPGNLTAKIKSWCTVACQHALPPVAHSVSAELQEMLVLHRDSTVDAERRLISKAIW